MEQQHNEHFYCIGEKEIGNYNTVSNGPDNGFNNNVARWMWRSMRHSITEIAVNNWLSSIKNITDDSNEIELFGSGNLVIAGHGNEGFLETGAGQSGQQNWRTNYLMTWNKIYWEEHLTKLKTKNFPIIYIYSCHSGTGESGADFLFALAQVVGKPVAGRTGFTYSNNRPQVWFEKGSVWQVATPDRRPNPINAPTPHFTKMFELKIYFEDRFIIVDPKHIKSVKVERHFLSQVSSRQLGIDQKLSSDLVSEFFSSEPFYMEGQLSAMITGKLVIEIEINQSIKYLTFHIYNDRLIGDQFGNYYYSNPSVQGLLKMI